MGGHGQRWAWSFSSWAPKIRFILWIELIFFMLTVMQSFLVKPTCYSISLIFKCQSIAVVLVRPTAVAERVLWNSVWPSIHSVVGHVFLESLNQSLNFSIFQHGARTPFEVVCKRAWFFGKTFALKIGEKFLHNENLYYLLCSCTNPAFGKNLIPEI